MPLPLHTCHCIPYTYQGTVGKKLTIVEAQPNRANVNPSGSHVRRSGEGQGLGRRALAAQVGAMAGQEEAMSRQPGDPSPSAYCWEVCEPRECVILGFGLGSSRGSRGHRESCTCECCCPLSWWERGERDRPALVASRQHCAGTSTAMAWAISPPRLSTGLPKGD